MSGDKISIGTAAATTPGFDNGDPRPNDRERVPCKSDGVGCQDECEHLLANKEYRNELSHIQAIGKHGTYAERTCTINRVRVLLAKHDSLSSGLCPNRAGGRQVVITTQHAKERIELVRWLRSAIEIECLPNALRCSAGISTEDCDELLEDLEGDGSVRDIGASCSKCEWEGKLKECHAGTEETPWLCPKCREAAMVNVRQAGSLTLEDLNNDN